MPRDSAFVIRPEELLQAYRLGYFPMAEDRDASHVVWVLPDERGVLELKNASAPKRLRRFIKKQPFEVRLNHAFRRVMEKCAEPTPLRPDTWINDQIFEVYCELHHIGVAHSVECYDEGELVGGLYGVAIGGVFCGESMFSRKTDASKIALAYLIALLKMQGFSVLDTQFYTEHLGQFGVEEISNTRYQRLLGAHMNDRVSFNGVTIETNRTQTHQMDNMGEAEGVSPTTTANRIRNDHRKAGPGPSNVSSPCEARLSVETVLQSITQTS